MIFRNIFKVCALATTIVVSIANAAPETQSGMNVPTQLMLEYLTECTNIELKPDTCLVNTFFDYLSTSHENKQHSGDKGVVFMTKPETKEISSARRRLRASDRRKLQKIPFISASNIPNLTAQLPPIISTPLENKLSDIVDKVNESIINIFPFNLNNMTMNSDFSLFNIPTVTVNNKTYDLSPDEVYAIFQVYLDFDEDGMVSSEEVEFAAASFLDQNQDGVISLDEYSNVEKFIASAFSFMFPGHLNQTLVTDQIKTFDLDSDGVLSAEEKEKAREVILLVYADIFPDEEILLQVDQMLGQQNLSYVLDVDRNGELNATDLLLLQNALIELQENGFNLDDSQNFSLSDFGLASDETEKIMNLMEQFMDRKYLLEQLYANFTSDPSIDVNGTKSEVFKVFDLNDDGVIDSEEYDMVQSMLLELYENGIYPGQIPYLGQENLTSLVDQVSVELAFSMVMNDPRVPLETKEMLMSTMDLDSDGLVTETDFELAYRVLVDLYPQVVNFALSDHKLNVGGMCDLSLPGDIFKVHILTTAAYDKCLESGIEISSKEMNETTNALLSLFESGQCFASVCSEDTKKDIVAEWMKTCANIELPKALPSPSDIEVDPEHSKEEIKLSCMFDFVMDARPEDFGLKKEADSTEQCFPPGYYDMENVCHDNIGPAALDVCKDDEDAAEEEEEEFFHSYSYSFSYNYDFWSSYDSGINDSKSKLEDEKYIDNLCSKLVELSSDAGKQCLLPFCIDDDFNWRDEYDKETSKPPAFYPTAAPTNLLPSAVSDSTTAPHSSDPPAPSQDHQTPTSSNPPSLPPSKMENQNIPTKSPSINSRVVTSEPTSSPSEFLETAVEVKFQAAITFENLSEADIPLSGPGLKAMVQVLTNAITDNLPDGCKARILKVAGINVNTLFRRRMEDNVGVEIEFEVTKRIPCAESCDEALKSSDEFYASATDQLESAVTSGTLETSIQSAAAESGVTSLQNVQVNEDSFSAEEPETTIIVNEKDDEDEDEDDNSSAKEKIISKALLFALTCVAVAMI